MNEEVEDKLGKFTEEILSFCDSLGDYNNILGAEIDAFIKAGKEEKLQIVSKWKEEAVTEDQQMETIEIALKSVEQLRIFLSLILRTARMRKKIINMPKESLSLLVIKQIKDLVDNSGGYS